MPHVSKILFLGLVFTLLLVICFWVLVSFYGSKFPVDSNREGSASMNKSKFIF